MKSVKRLGIFCFFDEAGFVDSYVEYLLKDLKTVLNELIVVVNGIVTPEGRALLETYADQIVVRENKGYDLGAYAYVLRQVVGQERIHDWDEVVLCNDTFFGPFVPFETIFHSMEPKNQDLWGLNLVEDGFLTHIQSYFLVFRKKVIESDALFSYLDKQDQVLDMEAASLEDVLAFFEIGLFAYLKEQGYTYGAYTNTGVYDVYRNPEICIRKYQLPILKRKCFSKSYINMYDLPGLLRYMEENIAYDSEYIRQSVRRTYGDVIQKDAYTLMHTLTERENVVHFIKEHGDIYVYGTGVYARKIWMLFHGQMERFQGFIVSDNQGTKLDSLYGYKVMYYSQVDLGSAFIIGCDYTNTKSILKKVKPEDYAFSVWENVERKQ